MRLEISGTKIISNCRDGGEREIFELVEVNENANLASVCWTSRIVDALAHRPVCHKNRNTSYFRKYVAVTIFVHVYKRHFSHGTFHMKS